MLSAVPECVIEPQQTVFDDIRTHLEFIMLLTW